MHRDNFVKRVLIAITIGTAVTIAWQRDLHFPIRDWVRPVGLCGLLWIAKAYYQKRAVENFAACLQAMVYLVAFSTSFTVLTYAVATLGSPLVDAQLMSCDQALGIHLPDIVAWANRHPQVQQGLQWTYDSLLYQTPLVLIVLGLAGSQRHLDDFILQFMIAAWLTVLVFVWAPALGPFAAYNYPTQPSQDRYLEHFLALRDGSRTLISWRNAEGLITVPSFHTSWAILLAFAFRDWKWLLPPAIALNICVVIATLTSGWHYATDVVLGAVVAATSLLLVAVSGNWRYAMPTAD